MKTLKILLVLVGFVGLQAVWELVYPRFTDEQLMNFVDTWEPHAIGTGVVLLFLLGVIVVAAVAVWNGEQSIRRLALAILIATVVAGGVQIWNHVVLTDRTARVTGQTFGGFYGLF